MPGAILDTSVFIVAEQGRPLGRPLTDEVSVSVVTLAELELGVLVARDADTRAQRLATLTRVREQTAGLPADDRVASAYARLAAAELASGRKPRGPSSTAPRPRPATSRSTRSVASWQPQPGTSQTPQVIGAPARRSGGPVT